MAGMNTHSSIHRAGPMAVLGLVAIAATSLTAQSANAADVGITCGTVVTSDLRLTADLLDCPGPGLVVSAPDITIDLAGHVIDGTGVGAAIDNQAGHDGVTITRGTVREFLFGVALHQADGNRIDRVVASSNIGGFVVSSSENVELDRVSALGSLGTGIEITFSDDVTLRRSTAAENGLFGIVDRFSSGTRFERNTTTGNEATGLVVDLSEHVVVERNDALGNNSDGIEVTRATDAVVERNHATANAGVGITVIDPGVTVTLTRNRADANQGAGIAADPGTLDGGGNRARGNLAGECSGVTCR